MLVAARKRHSKGFTPKQNRSFVRSRGSNARPSTSNIKVVVRVRPRNDKDGEQRNVVEVVDEKMLIFDPKEREEPFYVSGVKQKSLNVLKRKNKESEFLFDKVYGMAATNQEVFEGSAKELIKALLEGYNCSVFVYGATGAGKTYTMLGNKSCPGISYLTMVELYRAMGSLAAEKDFDLSMSYLEVYNETVHDLITPSGPLSIRDDGVNGTIVSGIKIHRIQNAEELFSMLEKGNKNRTQHPTDANAESSRSHAVFQVLVRITDKMSNQVKLAKLLMIDLAGSERGAATGYSGKRFCEGSNINKSLLALGNCVNALADGQKHIPYRDSKLTRLLKDSLGGNCKTVMIANVAPSCLNYEETYNTLNYATRAKKISTKIRSNVYSVDVHVNHYIKLVEELRTKNAMLEEELEELRLCNRPAAAGPLHSPALPNMIQQEELVKQWKEKLQCMYQEQGLYCSEILKLDMEMKILRWRIALKEMISSRLDVFTYAAPHINKGRARISESVGRLQRQLLSYKEKLKHMRQLQVVHENKMKAVGKQLMEEEVLEDLKPTLSHLADRVEQQNTLLQLQNRERLLSLQQNEMRYQERVISELSTTMELYYAVLNGYDKLTSSMKDKYLHIVHILSGAKEVSWVDVPAKDSNGFSLLKKVINLSLEGYDLSPDASGVGSAVVGEGSKGGGSTDGKQVGGDQELKTPGTCPPGLHVIRSDTHVAPEVGGGRDAPADGDATFVAPRSHDACWNVVKTSSLPEVTRPYVEEEEEEEDAWEWRVGESLCLNSTYSLSPDSQCPLAGREGEESYKQGASKVDTPPLDSPHEGGCGTHPDSDDGGARPLSGTWAAGRCSGLHTGCASGGPKSMIPRHVMLMGTKPPDRVLRDSRNMLATRHVPKGSMKISPAMHTGRRGSSNNKENKAGRSGGRRQSPFGGDGGVHHHHHHHRRLKVPLQTACQASPR